MALLGNVSSNNIKKLFDYKPAYGNMFTVYVYAGSSIGLSSDVASYSGLHATSIKFAGAQLTLKRHNVSKLFSLEKFQLSDLVTITWREDSEFFVRKMHQEWLASFYNKEKDHFISYDSQLEANKHLTRTIKIVLQNGYEIKLEGVLPQSIPDLDLSWESSNVVTYSLTYYVPKWSWIKNNKVGPSSDSYSRSLQ